MPWACISPEQQPLEPDLIRAQRDMAQTAGALVTLVPRPQSRTTETQAAEQPEYENNDQYQTQGAAQARPTIPSVPVIATAAAEQQDEQDNDQNCTHFNLPLSQFTRHPTPLGRQAAPQWIFLNPWS
jgi:hypothetical protein